jgi:hypothetical protein
MHNQGFEWSRDREVKTDPVPAYETVFCQVVDDFDVTHQELYFALGNMQDGLSVGIDERLASEEYEVLAEVSIAWYLHVSVSKWRKLYRNHNYSEIDDACYRAAMACHTRQARCAPGVDDEALDRLPAERQVLVIAKPDSRLEW